MDHGQTFNKILPFLSFLISSSLQVQGVRIEENQSILEAMR